MPCTKGCVTCVHWNTDRLCVLRNKMYSVPLDNCPAWGASKVGRKWEAEDTNKDSKYNVQAVSRYEELGSSIGKLVQEKQAAYGDSFGKAGKVLAILYPDGIPLAKYDDALTVVRVVDKLFRVATDRGALGENPWRDICGYALLAVEWSEKPNQVRSDLEGEGK